MTKETSEIVEFGPLPLWKRYVNQWPMFASLLFMIVFANSKWLRNYFNIIPHGNFLLLCLYLLPGGWHLFLRNVKIAKKLQLKGYDIVLSDIQAITCFYGVKKNVLCGLPPRDEVILLPLSHLEHKGYMNSEPKNDCLLILKAAKIRELQ